MVDLAGAADHRFAEAEVGIDHRDAEVAADRVHAEGDAGRVAVRHLLHHHRHLRVAVVEAVAVAVGDRPVVPERDEAIADRREYRRRTMTVKESIVLAGEGGVGEVLHRR